MSVMSLFRAPLSAGKAMAVSAELTLLS